MRRALALVVGLIAFAAAAGEAPVLDGGLKRALAGAPGLRGAALAPETLDRKIVVVTFFASWCPPCHVEFRHLNEIHAAYAGRGVAVVAVNLFEDFGGLSGPAKLEAFLDRYDPAFAVVAGTDAIADGFGGVSRIPTLFVFDRDGRIVYDFVNARGAARTSVSAAELRAVIEPLLRPAPPAG